MQAETAAVADARVLLNLNRAYIEAVQRSDARWFDRMLTSDFRCSLPDGTFIVVAPKAPNATGHWYEEQEANNAWMDGLVDTLLARYNVDLDRIYIWGILPVEARLLVILTTFYSVFAGLGPIGGGIAHWAHLGGYVGAWIYLEFLGHSSAQREFRKKMDTALYGNRNPIVSDDLRPELIPRDGLHPLNVEELDRLSEKMKVHGATSLTSDERAFLHRMRSRYS